VLRVGVVGKGDAFVGQEGGDGASHTASAAAMPSRCFRTLDHPGDRHLKIGSRFRRV
jgi:hypothetical protein